MIKEIYSLIKEMLSRLFSSRLFALALIFTGLFCILTVHLFRLQIMNGQSYLENYQKNTEQNIVLPGTRGNIYDKDGNFLLIMSFSIILPLLIPVLFRVIQRESTREI